MQPTQKKILVIDDEVGAVGSVQQRLFTRDYSFADIQYCFCDTRDERGKFSLEKAMEFVQQHQDAQALLLDLNFGSEKMGYQILEKLVGYHLPVCMITSETGSQVREKCSELGAQSFMPKDALSPQDFYQGLVALIQSKK